MEKIKEENTKDNGSFYRIKRDSGKGCIRMYIYLLMYLYAKPPKVIDKNCNM